MKIAKLRTAVIAAVLACAPALIVNATHMSNETVEKRLAPLGSVYVEGDEVPEVTANAVVSAPAAGGARDGESIYNTYCLACHMAGVAGAPKTGDAAAWNARMEKGFDMVLQNAINGINAMPAKGTCVDCSDEEIKLSIDYILANSQ